MEDFEEEDLEVHANHVLKYDRPPIMGTFKLEAPKFEVKKYNGRIDYLLWEHLPKEESLSGIQHLQCDDIDAGGGDEWKSM